MIITEKIDITITNQGKYWSSLGYGTHKQGTIITVLVKDLPKNSNKKIECRCDVCNKVWVQSYQVIMKMKDTHKCNSCNRKYVGTINNSSENAKKRGKSYIGSNHPRWNPNKKAFSEYDYKVRRITEQNYEKNKHIINPDNLPRTLCGVENGYQLDHKISIKWGYTHGVNPKVIGSMENLQMLKWCENRKKHINI